MDPSNPGRIQALLHSINWNHSIKSKASANSGFAIPALVYPSCNLRICLDPLNLILVL